MKGADKQNSRHYLFLPAIGLQQIFLPLFLLHWWIPLNSSVLYGEPVEDTESVVFADNSRMLLFSEYLVHQCR